MMKNILIGCLCVHVVSAALSGTNPPIATKNLDAFDWIWDDKGSGAYLYGSYWHPHILAYDYFVLGDVVGNSYSAPEVMGTVVKELEPGALKQPVSFTKIWNDKGTGADRAIQIYRMNPPEGYICLGNAAVSNYLDEPIASKYRCVKSAYVVEGALEMIWNDKGSKGDVDGCSWRVVRGADLKGQEAGTFLTATNYNSPADTPYMLNSDYARDHNTISGETGNPGAAIKLYKMNSSSIMLQWNDHGSHGYYALSCYRVIGPGDTYRLGDIALGNYNQLKYGLVAKAIEEDALQAPYDYEQVWNDKGSKATMATSFWEPKCEGGYVAIGHLCQNNYNKPSVNDMRCVKEEHVTEGAWRGLWTDEGTGATLYGSAFMALPDNAGEQGMELMTSLDQETWTMPATNIAYVLKGDHTDLIDAKPAKKYFLTNVEYNIDLADVVDQGQLELARTTVQNEGDSVQTTSRTLAAEWSETREWSNTAGLELSADMEIHAGIPFIAEMNVDIGAATTLEGQYGHSITETMTDSTTAELSVQPHCQKTMTMIGINYKADIPFTADIKTEYEDGTTDFRRAVEGIYYGTSVGDRLIIYGPDIPLQRRPKNKAKKNKSFGSRRRVFP